MAKTTLERTRKYRSTEKYVNKTLYPRIGRCNQKLMELQAERIKLSERIRATMAYSDDDERELNNLNGRIARTQSKLCRLEDARHIIERRLRPKTVDSILPSESVKMGRPRRNPDSPSWTLPEDHPKYGRMFEGATDPDYVKRLVQYPAITYKLYLTIVQNTPVDGDTRMPTPERIDTALRQYAAQHPEYCFVD